MTEFIYSYVENAIGKPITRISMEHALLCLRNMSDDDSDVSQLTKGLRWELVEDFNKLIYFKDFNLKFILKYGFVGRLGRMIDSKVITREGQIFTFLLGKSIDSLSSDLGNDNVKVTMDDFYPFVS